MFYDLCTIKYKSFRFYDVNNSDLSEVWCFKENENEILTLFGLGGGGGGGGSIRATANLNCCNLVTA